MHFATFLSVSAPSAPDLSGQTSQFSSRNVWIETLISYLILFCYKLSDCKRICGITKWKVPDRCYCTSICHMYTSRAIASVTMHAHDTNHVFSKCTSIPKCSMHTQSYTVSFWCCAGFVQFQLTKRIFKRSANSFSSSGPGSFLPSFLSSFVPPLPSFLPTSQPTYLPTYLSTYLPTYLPTYLTYLPTYLPTYLT